jgi:hypothetical protein
LRAVVLRVAVERDAGLRAVVERRAAGLRAVVLRVPVERVPVERDAGLRAVVERAAGLRAAGLRAVVERDVVLRVPVERDAAVRRVAGLRVVLVRRVPVELVLRPVVDRVLLPLVRPELRLADARRVPVLDLLCGVAIYLLLGEVRVPWQPTSEVCKLPRLFFIGNDCLPTWRCPVRDTVALS